MISDRPPRALDGDICKAARRALVLALQISEAKLSSHIRTSNDIEVVIRPLKVGLNNYGYCHNHDAAYRAAMIYSFIATCNKVDVNPREWNFVKLR